MQRGIKHDGKQSFLTSKEIRWWQDREETSNFRCQIHPIPKVIIAKSDFTFKKE